MPDSPARRPAPAPAAAEPPPDSSRLGPFVSSAHLASGGLPALSEFEFGLIMASHAFHRWMVRAMAASGYADLSALDIMVLHSVNHRGRTKRLADICLVLNVEDTHLVTYALKKLAALGLIKSQKAGKEKAVAITPQGEAACLKYREIREQVLVASVKSLGLNETALSDVAARLRMLSGHYDSATRTAASL